MILNLKKFKFKEQALILRRLDSAAGKSGILSIEKRRGNDEGSLRAWLVMWHADAKTLVS